MAGADGAGDAASTGIGDVAASGGADEVWLPVPLEATLLSAEAPEFALL